MIEIIIALMIVSISIIGFVNIKVPSKLYLYQKLSQINYLQTVAILENREVSIEGTSLYFNRFGNINQAMTINYLNYRIIFRLGFGNRRYE